MLALLVAWGMAGCSGTVRLPVCGNGKVEGRELCDDGNLDPGDGCDENCLLESRDGLLFTGDTFYPGMLYAHFDDSDFDAYRQSIAHLVGLLDQVSVLCPAHNEAYVPKEILPRVREGFERIAAGETRFEIEGTARVYRFEGFGVVLPHGEEA